MPLPLDPLLQAMPVGFMAINQDWVVTHLNPAGSAVVGKTPAELIGANFFEAFPDNLDNEFGRVYRHAMQQREPRMVESFYP